MTTFFDAKAYGATGDGHTNDTQALQAAIDAAAQVGGTVRLGPGTYRVSAFPGGEGQCLSLKAGVTLAGAGAERTAITPVAGESGLSAVVRGAGNDITLSGLTLDAQHAALSGYVNGLSDRVTLSGVVASNADAYGFDLHSAGSQVRVRAPRAPTPWLAALRATSYSVARATTAWAAEKTVMCWWAARGATALPAALRGTCSVSMR